MARSNPFQMILLAFVQERASPALVERLPVEYYGSPTPLMQLASISIPEPRSIMIKPFDAGSLRILKKRFVFQKLGLESQL
jgi:ribosome recycling factor